MDQSKGFHLVISMTIRPWHPNEPLADDNLSDSQPKIQQNTNTLQAILEKNMVPFGDPNAGLFKQIDLKNITSLPPQVSGFSGIYSLNGKLVFRDSNSVVTPIPLDLNTFNQGYVNIGGWIVQMGTSSLQVQRVNAINFPIEFPNECRIVLMTPIKGGKDFPRIKLLRWVNKFFEADTDSNTNITWVAFGR